MPRAYRGPPPRADGLVSGLARIVGFFKRWVIATLLERGAELILDGPELLRKREVVGDPVEGVFSMTIPCFFDSSTPRVMGSSAPGDHGGGACGRHW